MASFSDQSVIPSRTPGVDHLHQQFEAISGDVLEVRISRPAWVRVLDSGQYESFLRHGPYRYHGGFFERSPVQIPIPRSGPWHLVVDLGGGTGKVQADMRILPQGD